MLTLPSVRHGCWGCRSWTHSLLQKLSNILSVIRYRWSQIAPICAETKNVSELPKNIECGVPVSSSFLCLCQTAWGRVPPITVVDIRGERDGETGISLPKPPDHLYPDIRIQPVAPTPKTKASSTPAECWQCISDPCVGIVPQAVCWNFVSHVIWNSVRSAKVLLV